MMINEGRKAGIAYLLIILTGIFSHLIVRTNLIDFSSSVITADNILNNQLLFRFSILSDFVMILSYLFLGLTLFGYFKIHDKKLALLLLALNILGTSMMSINMINQYAAIYILNGNLYLNTFSGGELETLSLLFLKLHSIGYKLSSISYGIWLFPMGLLFYKTKTVPKVISIFLILGSVSYILTFISYILNLPLNVEITIVADLGEFSLCLWLLIKGVTSTNEEKKA